MNKKGEKRNTNKYNIVIGLFYAVGLFVVLGVFFIIGLIYNAPMVWTASLFEGICSFLIIGLVSHAVITLIRKDSEQIWGQTPCQKMTGGLTPMSALFVELLHYFTHII